LLFPDSQWALGRPNPSIGVQCVIKVDCDCGISADGWMDGMGMGLGLEVVWVPVRVRWQHVYPGRTPVRGLGATQDIIRSQKEDYNVQQHKNCAVGRQWQNGNPIEVTLKWSAFAVLGGENLQERFVSGKVL